MHEIVYRIIAGIGLGIIVLGNYFSLKNKTRKKYTYLLFILGGFALLSYSIYVKDVIFIILQGVFIISAIIENYIAKKK